MELTNKGKGISTVVGSLFLEFMFGSLYTWPSINAYYMSYLKENGNPEIKLLDGYFMMPIISTIGMIFGIVGTKLDLMFGLKRCLQISLPLILVSHLIILFTTNLYVVYFAMSLFGIGNGLSMLGVLKNCWLFFPDQKGFVSGVVLFGLGSSSSIFTMIADLIINPKFSKVDALSGFFHKDISLKTYDFILTLTIIIGVLALLGYCFIFDQTTLPKEAKSTIETKEINNDVHLVSGKSKPKEDEEVKSPLKQAFSDIRIYQMTLMNFCSLYPCFLCMNTYRSFGQLNLMDESTLSLLSKVNPLINGVGRIIWGLLADHVPFKCLYAFLLLMTISFSVGFYYIVSYPWFYFALVCFIAFIFSGNICVLVPMFPKIYGLKYSAQIYAVSVALSGFNSLLSPIIAKIIVKQIEDYKLLYFTGTFLAVISLIVCLFFKDVKFRYSTDKDDAKGEELITKT